MTTHSGQVPTLVITGAHPQLYNHDLAPTAPEGRGRIEHFWANGATTFAFWFAQPFPQPELVESPT